MVQYDDLLIIELRETPIAGGRSPLVAGFPNVTNYHKFIVDATQIADLFSDPDSEKARRTAITLQSLASNLGDIVPKGARVVFILPPPAVRLLPYQEGGQRKNLPITQVLGGLVKRTPNTGLKVDTIALEAKRYFRRIASVDGELKLIGPGQSTFEIAAGPYGQLIAARIERGMGSYTFLPPYADLPANAVRTVAEDFLHARLPDEEWPSWIDTVPFAAVQNAISVLQEAQIDLQRAEQNLKQAMEQLERAREPLAVIVGTGVQGLQEPCRSLFDAIGVRTEPVRPDVSDEFMLRGGSIPVLVEVKGLEGHARKSDLNQLLTDAAHWEEVEEGRKVKPLLLVNSHRLMPLVERESGDNHAFAQWVEEKAPILGVALMSTWDLLAVYYAAQSNPKLGPALLVEILSTAGRVNVSKVT